MMMLETLTVYSNPVIVQRKRLRPRGDVLEKILEFGQRKSELGL